MFVDRRLTEPELILSSFQSKYSLTYVCRTLVNDMLADAPSLCQCILYVYAIMSASSKQSIYS